MNIMVIVDTRYYKYLVVLMKSLFINHPDKRFNFYVVYRELSDEAKYELAGFCAQHDSQMYFIFKNTDIFQGLKAKSIYPIELYWKLIPHEVIPDTVDKILFLDVDMIVDGRIDDILTLDFPDNTLLYGCRGIKPFRSHYILKEEQSVDTDSINSGFMYFNLDKMREAGITLDTYKKYLSDKTQRLYEEELLNNTLKNGEIRHLYPFDYNYNVGAHKIYLEYTRPNNIKMRKLVRHYMFFGTKKFGQYLKPWELYFNPEPVNDDSELRSIWEQNFPIWWQYAKQTPYYDEFFTNAMPSTLEYLTDKAKKNEAAVYRLKKLKAIQDKLLTDKTATENIKKFLVENNVKEVGLIQIGGSMYDYIVSIMNQYAIAIKYAVDKVTELEDMETIPKTDMVITCNISGVPAVFKQSISEKIVSIENMI